MEEGRSRRGGGGRLRPLLAVAVFLASGALIGLVLGLWLSGPVEPRPVLTRSLTDVDPFLEQIEDLRAERDLLARRLAEAEELSRAAAPPQPPEKSETAAELSALKEERDLLEQQLGKSVGERDRLRAGLEALQRRLAAEEAGRARLESQVAELSRDEKSRGEAAAALEAERRRLGEAESARQAAEAARQAAEAALEAAKAERQAAETARRTAESDLERARRAQDVLELDLQEQVKHLEEANARLQQRLAEAAASPAPQVAAAPEETPALAAPEETPALVPPEVPEPPPEARQPGEVRGRLQRPPPASEGPLIEPVAPRQPGGATASPGSVQAGVEAYRVGDYRGAFHIWLPLAEAGVAKAQFHLGALYFEGRGVPRSLPEAYRWLASADAAGYPEAGPLLEAVSRTMTARELEEARRLLAEG